MTIILLLIIIFLGVLIIVLFAFLYFEVIYWYKARKIKHIQRENVACSNSIGEFKQRLVHASFSMMKEGKKIEYPTLFSDTFYSRFLINIRQKGSVNVFSCQYSECGWLIYAIMEADGDIQIVKNYFDRHIYNQKIHCVDQSQCGMVALILYRKTQEIKYKNYADNLYQFLVERETEFGLPYRDVNSPYILVDTLGMAIPFIIEYTDLFLKMSQLAYRTIDKFLMYGTDAETGLPVFSFSTTSPHIKCGMSNWGRGCSWLVIGLSYINEMRICQFSSNQIRKLDKTLVSIWERDKMFGHFIGETERDLSAELPILYYLYKKKLITLSDSDILNYSKMCHDGVLYNSSNSNIGIIRYGTCLGPNVLSQAYMLRLICEYEAQQYR